VTHLSDVNFAAYWASRTSVARSFREFWSVRAAARLPCSLITIGAVNAVIRFVAS